jgi:hypothetical protein
VKCPETWWEFVKIRFLKFIKTGIFLILIRLINVNIKNWPVRKKVLE